MLARGFYRTGFDTYPSLDNFVKTILFFWYGPNKTLRMWSRLGEQMYDWHPRLHPCPDTFGRTTSLIRPSRRADEPLPRGDPEMSIFPGSVKEGNSRYLSKYASQMWLKAPCQLKNIARGQGIEMCWVRYSNRPRGRAHPPDVVSCAGWKPDWGLSSGRASASLVENHRHLWLSWTWVLRVVGCPIFSHKNRETLCLFWGRSTIQMYLDLFTVGTFSGGGFEQIQSICCNTTRGKLHDKSSYH